MKRLLPILIPLLLGLAAPALAYGPLTMSYQGVLTDAGGNLVPDGSYTLTFRIYDVASSGSALWTEVQSGVAVAKGGFGVILGSITAIHLPFDTPYYLGIQVGASAELAPRVPLASSPYAMSVWVPSTGSAVSEARLSAYPAGSYYGDGGGYLHLLDPSGNSNFDLEPRFVAGGGAYMRVLGANSSLLRWDGITSGGAGGLTLTGSGSTSQFFTGYSGDLSVQLPANAISASEILDEPGVAQGHVNGSVNVPIGSTMGDIVTVTLTTPAAGYIVVEANAEHLVGATTTATSNYAYFQIDETAGGGYDNNHDCLSGYGSGTPGTHTGYTYIPLSVRRTYYKPAGTYTFRLEAYGIQSESLSNYVWSPTITATFYPTSYGTVTTAVTPEEASRFSNVQRTVSAGQLPQEGSVDGALVDLRELELRATQKRLEAEQAERRLIEARLAQQNAKRTAK